MESDFQKEVIDNLRAMFPGCYILKNDAGYLQGVPDLTLLWGKHWATLEVKSSETAKPRPNQPYHVSQMNMMSFSAFLYPENKDEVLDDLQRAFGSKRSARVSKSIRLPLD